LKNRCNFAYKIQSSIKHEGEYLTTNLYMSYDVVVLTSSTQDWTLGGGRREKEGGGALMKQVHRLTSNLKARISIRITVLSENFLSPV